VRLQPLGHLSVQARLRKRTHFLVEIRPQARQGIIRLRAEDKNVPETSRKCRERPVWKGPGQTI
jgi:hypothetical protein